MNAYAVDHAFLPCAFFGGGMGGGEILVVLIVLLLLFGARRLPELARAIGGAISEFRRATGNLADDIASNAVPTPSSFTPSAQKPAGAPTKPGNDFTPRESDNTKNESV